jgi:hypothetical protein
MNRHPLRLHGGSPLGGRRWIWLAAGLLIWACGGHYPYFAPSQQVSDQFESGVPPEGYLFFITGPAYRPEALIGVVAEFAPPAGGPWKAAPGDAADWRQLVRGMQFFDEEAHTPGAYGALLRLPDGRPIGIWYSARGLGTVNLDEAGRLWVWPPQQRREVRFHRDF